MNRKNLIAFYIVYCLILNADIILQTIGLFLGGVQALLTTALLYAAVFFTFFLLAPVYKYSLSILVSSRWLLLLYAWHAVSIFWAPDARIVLGVFATIFPLFLCGVVASYYFSSAEAIDLFRKTILFLAVASAIVQAVAPQVAAGISIAPGWTGVYGEKNHFGVGMAVGCIAVLASPKPWTVWKFLQFGLVAVLLVGSQSSTATAAVFVAFVAYLFLLTGKRKRPLFIAALIGSTILAFALIPSLPAKVLGIAGKSTNLTGRDVIWAFCIKYWKQKPILGFGTYGFWSAHSDEILLEFGWNPGEAHNGFIELLLTTGVIGVAFLLAALAAGGHLIRKAFRTRHFLAGRWLLLVWLALLVENITESDFMVPGPLWFCYCLAFFVTYAEVQRGVSRVEGESASTLGGGLYDLNLQLAGSSRLESEFAQ